MAWNGLAGRAEAVRPNIPIFPGRRAEALVCGNLQPVAQGRGLLRAKQSVGVQTMTYSISSRTIANMEQATKQRENRLRGMATRYGLRLEKSKSRDPSAIDYGLYALIRPETGGAVNAAIAQRWVCSWNLDTVEQYLSQR